MLVGLNIPTAGFSRTSTIKYLPHIASPQINTVKTSVDKGSASVLELGFGLMNYINPSIVGFTSHDVSAIHICGLFARRNSLIIQLHMTSS